MENIKSREKLFAIETLRGKPAFKQIFFLFEFATFRDWAVVVETDEVMETGR